MGVARLKEVRISSIGLVLSLGLTIASFGTCSYGFTRFEPESENYENHPLSKRHRQLTVDNEILQTAKENLVYIPPHLNKLTRKYFPEEFNIRDIPPANAEVFPKPKATKLLIDSVQTDLIDMPSQQLSLQKIEESLPNLEVVNTNDLSAFRDQILRIDDVRREIETRSFAVDDIAWYETKTFTRLGVYAMGTFFLGFLAVFGFGVYREKHPPKQKSIAQSNLPQVPPNLPGIPKSIYDAFKDDDLKL